MAPKVEIIHDEKLILGEGPHWDAEANVLYYVDIEGSTVFKFDPITKIITRVIVDDTTRKHIGFVVPVAGAKDKFVIGLGKELGLLTWDGISTVPAGLEILTEVDQGTENRFNDGKVDPKGRLWAGTMAKHIPEGPELRKGSLYSLNADGKAVKTHFGDVGISNGLTWSSDDKTFYYVDSFNRSVDAFDYDIDTAELKNRRTVFDLVKNKINGLPDGMTIDIEDKLWLATWGGYAVHRVDPNTGVLLQSVELPASKITSATWGGANLDELYVTSSSLFEEETPYSGRVFKITGLGTSGLPGVSVKL